jgi:hypothetical protein
MKPHQIVLLVLATLTFGLGLGSGIARNARDLDTFETVTLSLFVVFIVLFWISVMGPWKVVRK